MKESRRVPAFAVFAVACLLAEAADAQRPPKASDLTGYPSPTLDSGNQSQDRSNESQALDLADTSSQVSMSASQIISICRSRPEVIVEMKDLMAETQHGDNVEQSDAISDEKLYTRIVTDREFRQRVTMFLRARGYVNDEELQIGAAGGRSALDQQGPTASSSSMDPLQGMGALDSAPIQGTRTLNANSYTYQDGYPARANESASPFYRDGARLPSNYASSTTGRPSNDADNITNPPPVLRRPAPYNLNSLRDLYTQIPESGDQLKRFGSEVFTRRDRVTSAVALMDVPVGPDYVLGAGDTLTIDLWGGVAQTLSRVVAADGHLNLPEAGDIQIAGLRLEKAQGLIQEALKRQFRDVQVSVTLSRLRTFRVYVVGDVQRPGAYEISSLASPVSALYAAGGPTAIGSLRSVKHYRGKQLVGTVDLYDFLLIAAESKLCSVPCPLQLALAVERSTPGHHLEE